MTEDEKNRIRSLLNEKENKLIARVMADYMQRPVKLNDLAMTSRKNESYDGFDLYFATEKVGTLIRYVDDEEIKLEFVNAN